MNLVLSPEMEQRIADIIESFIKENPIVISNLIETQVNGIISDVDIKPLVLEHVRSRLAVMDSTQNLSDIVKDCITEIIQDRQSDIAAMSKQAIDAYFQTEEFKDGIQVLCRDIDLDEVIRNNLNEIFDQSDIDRAVENHVEEAIPEDREIQRRLDDAIEEKIADEFSEGRIAQDIAEAIEVKLTNDLLMSELRSQIGTINLTELAKQLLKEYIDTKAVVVPLSDVITPTGSVTEVIPPAPVPEVVTPSESVSEPITDPASKPNDHWIYISSMNKEMINSIYQIVKHNQEIMIQSSQGIQEI